MMETTRGDWARQASPTNRLRSVLLIQIMRAGASQASPTTRLRSVLLIQIMKDGARRVRMLQNAFRNIPKHSSAHCAQNDSPGHTTSGTTFVRILMRDHLYVRCAVWPSLVSTIASVMRGFILVTKILRVTETLGAVGSGAVVGDSLECPPWHAISVQKRDGFASSLFSMRRCELRVKIWR